MGNRVLNESTRSLSKTWSPRRSAILFFSFACHDHRRHSLVSREIPPVLLPARAKSECMSAAADGQCCAFVLYQDKLLALCSPPTARQVQKSTLLAMPVTKLHSESASTSACAITWKPAFRHPHILPLQPMALLHPRLALTGASPTWPAETRNEANELPRNKSHCGTMSNFQSLLNGAFPSPSPRLNRALC